MLAFESQTYPSLVDRLTEDIFEKIARGNFSPGEKITESFLAKTFDVSRTPIREAIMRLANLGILTIKPRTGVTVTPVDSDEYKEIMAFRYKLELFAAELFIENGTHEHILKLTDAQQRCIDILGSESRYRIFEEDGRFHLLFTRYAGNRYLTETLLRLEVKVHLCRMTFCRSPEKIREDIYVHDELISALQERDIELFSHLLYEHICTDI